MYDELLLPDGAKTAVIYNYDFFVIAIHDDDSIVFETYNLAIREYPLDSGEFDANPNTITIGEFLKELEEINRYDINYATFQENIRRHDNPDKLIVDLYEIRKSIKAFSETYFPTDRTVS